MRRRPGIQGLQRTVQARVRPSRTRTPFSFDDCSTFNKANEQTVCLKDQYKALGKDVAATRLEHMQAQMASFKENLEGFALKHR